MSSVWDAAPGRVRRRAGLMGSPPVASEVVGLRPGPERPCERVTGGDDTDEHKGTTAGGSGAFLSGRPRRPAEAAGRVVRQGSARPPRAHTGPQGADRAAR